MKEIPEFKVIYWDPNKDSLEFYDVMPRIISEWEVEKGRKHKIWASRHNYDIEKEDVFIGLEKGLSWSESSLANLSGKPYINDTRMPETYEEFEEFVDEVCLSYKSKCEYEVIVTGWPKQNRDYKLDVYEQIKANLQTVTKLFMNYILSEENVDRFAEEYVKKNSYGFKHIDDDIKEAYKSGYQKGKGV